MPDIKDDQAAVAAKAAPLERPAQIMPPDRFTTKEQAIGWLSNPIKTREALDAWMTSVHRSGVFSYTGLDYIGKMNSEVDAGSTGVYRYYNAGFINSHRQISALTGVLLYGTFGQSEDVPGTNTDCFHPQNWWHYRNYLRCANGVWELAFTSRLGGMVHMAAAWPHASKDDPRQIAYTPDRAAGESDKQLRTSPEKFLRKYMPLATDKYITTLANEWLASRDPRIHFTPAINADGTENTNAFLGACRFGKANSASCMRYDVTEFSTAVGNKRYHPMEAYIAPGWMVATMRADMDNPDPDGDDVEARAICWVNPENADDKRYVRIYPTDGGAVHARLKKNLEAQGFVKIGFGGAKLKTIYIEKPTSDGESATVVMPYLDGVDSPSDHTRGRYVSLRDDVLTIHDDAERVSEVRRLRQFNPRGLDYVFVVANSTSGYMSLQPVPKETWVCERTGVTYHFKDVQPVKVLVDDTLFERSAPLPGGVSARYANPKTYNVDTVDTLNPTLEHGGWRWVKCQATYDHLGFGQPDPVLYPTMKDQMVPKSNNVDVRNAWVHMYVGSEAEGNRRNVLVNTNDLVVQIFNSGSDSEPAWTFSRRHKSDVIPGSVAIMRKHIHQAVMAAPGAPLEKTSTGRIVFKGFHDLTTTLNGSLELSSYVKEKNLPYFAWHTSYVHESDNRNGDELFLDLDLTAERGAVQTLLRGARRVAQRQCSENDTAVYLARMAPHMPDTDGGVKRIAPSSTPSSGFPPAWAAALAVAARIASGEYVAQGEYLTDATKAAERQWARILLLIQEAYLQEKAKIDEAINHEIAEALAA